MAKIFVRSRYNYDMGEVSKDTGLSMVDPSTGELDVGRTQQEFAEETDINEIVRRFGLTGQLPDSPRLPQYGDFTDVTDFSSAMLAVRKAEEGFMELPAELRARFANDPQRLMEFLADEANRDEAVKLGLVNAEVKPPRDVVTAVDELAGKLLPPKPVS